MKMLFSLFVCSFLTLSGCVDLKSDDRIIVKLDPEQVVAAFKSVMSADYLKTLAHELASKAAEHFLVEMKNEQPTTESPVILRKPIMVTMDPNVPPAVVQPSAAESLKREVMVAESLKHEVIQEIERIPEEKILRHDINPSIIDIKQAMTLLKAPLPDGDNLDLVSPNLSEDEETKKSKKEPQVIQLMKVNGKYFRRLLGYL